MIAERVLHFPPDRAVGRIRRADESYITPEVSAEFHPGYVFTPPSQYRGLAQGEVRIPAGQCAMVHLGGPALTDRALPPLAAVPKLRALEICHSRITEQGLVHLYACQKLDSVHIRSSVPVRAQAVARLQAELPNLRTVDITQLEQSARSRPVRLMRAATAR